MSLDPIHRTILDSDGVPHEYTIRPHPASKGFRLGARLFGLFGGPLAGLLDGLGGTRSATDLLSMNIEWGSVGKALAEAVAMCDSTSLATEMLSNTMRDKVPLAKPGQFDAAYTANYGELIRALRAVVEVNRFLDFSGLGSLSGDETEAETGAESPIES